MSAPVIEVENLTKRYRNTVAVDGINLTIGRGEIFGLLGPNGAGKTTTILMLLGLTEPTFGSVRILGHDPLREPLEVKRRVGYLPDAVGFYDQLSARENLAFTARLGGIGAEDASARIEQAMARVRLTDVTDRRVSSFSRGMRQRLGIAELLVKGSEVAILDEPTAGLDPQSTQELLELIVTLSREGMTIVLSSHLLSMVQAICTRVALFNKGKVGLLGRVPDLASQVLGGAYVIEAEIADIDPEATLSNLEGVTRVSPMQSGLTRIDATGDVRSAVARTVVEAGGTLKSLSISRSDLDDVYARYFEEVSHAA
ncbi:ABC transporter ATP-binding protein [Martelella alba]|uniref:ABC transporter ATP-binding protein n=1 Tax=Martelella alba TaxID=2590451 RepID=A0A506UB46_9HYPH|nr:ABC transporter ATP-binding protein [Martelella alba]TPW30758.1 ABC transporter ATP-binding protein [Martelella alba]